MFSAFAIDPDEQRLSEIIVTGLSVGFVLSKKTWEASVVELLSFNGLPCASINEISNSITPSESPSSITYAAKNWLPPKLVIIAFWPDIVAVVSIRFSLVVNETETVSPTLAKAVLLLLERIDIGAILAGVSSIKISVILCEPSVIFPGRSFIVAFI